MALHPETKHGTPGVSRQVGDTRERAETNRFTADTAAKTGQSERAVQRDAARGKNIATEVLTQIAGTKLDTGRTLDELASVPKEAQPAKVDELKAADGSDAKQAHPLRCACPTGADCPWATPQPAG